MKKIEILEQSLKLLRDEKGLIELFKNLSSSGQQYLLEIGSRHGAIGEILIRNKFVRYAK
jgi:hypothetical protein